MVLDKVKDNGLVIKEISILDILVVIEKMAMENINGLMEIYIKVNFVKIWDKGKERWFGMMVVHIVDNGKGVFHMVKVHMIIFKSGIFKVKGEKPRAGYF